MGRKKGSRNKSIRADTRRKRFLGLRVNDKQLKIIKKAVRDSGLTKTEWALKKLLEEM